MAADLDSQIACSSKDDIDILDDQVLLDGNWARDIKYQTAIWQARTVMPLKPVRTIVRGCAAHATAADLAKNAKPC